jgi:hypothetical protein
MAKILWIWPKFGLQLNTSQNSLARLIFGMAPLSLHPNTPVRHAGTFPCATAYFHVLSLRCLIYYYFIRTQRGRPHLTMSPPPKISLPHQSPPSPKISLSRGGRPKTSPPSPHLPGGGCLRDRARGGGATPRSRDGERVGREGEHAKRPTRAAEERAGCWLRWLEGGGATSTHQLRRVLLFSAVACASVPSPSTTARASSASPHHFHQPSPHAATGSSSSRLRVGHTRTAVSMSCRLQLCGRGCIRSWGSNKVQLHSSLHPTRQSSPEREIRSLAYPMAAQAGIHPLGISSTCDNSEPVRGRDGGARI